MPSQAPRQIKTTIGQNLSAARRAKHLTQRELARVLDTDAFQVSRWERGIVRPGDSTLARLAEALGVDYVWFFIEHPEGIAA
jgi:transcriptional regulator with XRE-family HTH domain